MHLLEAIQSFTDVKLKQVEVPQVKGQETVREVLDFDEMSDIFGMVKFELSIGSSDGIKVDLRPRRSHGKGQRDRHRPY